MRPMRTPVFYHKKKTCILHSSQNIYYNLILMQNFRGWHVTMNAALIEFYQEVAWYFFQIVKLFVYEKCAKKCSKIRRQPISFLSFDWIM